MHILATHFTLSVFIVKRYYSGCYPTKGKREFVTEYNQDINIKTVNNVVDKWRRNGTICNLNKRNSGQPTHTKTAEIIA